MASAVNMTANATVAPPPSAAPPVWLFEQAAGLGRSPLANRCALRNLGTVPTLSQHITKCCAELPSCFPVETSCCVAPSTNFVVLLGDSTLKTKSSKGSKYILASELQELLPSPTNLLVIAWQGGKLQDLASVAKAVAEVANISRLVFVWQGNEYESLAPSRIPAVATHLLHAVRHYADEVFFQFPAPDSVWGYGEMYGEFAEAAARFGTSLFMEDSDVKTATPMEFESLGKRNSHLSGVNRAEVLHAMSSWIAASM